MKKKYAALLVAAAIMAVPGTLAMAAGSPNTNATVSHGGGHSSSASSKSAGLNVNAGTITNKTTTGIKKNFSPKWKSFCKSIRHKRCNSVPSNFM